MSEKELNITLDFAGGAQTLFDNIPSRKLTLDGCKTWTLKEFLVWMKKNILRDNPELFFQNDTVRHGILVLINEIDWELMGELDYVLKSNDNILFISTLHGG